MPNRRIKKRVSPIDLDQKFYDKDLSFLKTFLTEQGRITPRPGDPRGSPVCCLLSPLLYYI